MRAWVCAHLHMCVHPHVHVCMCVHASVCLHMRMGVCMCVLCVSAWTHVCAYERVHICAHMCIIPLPHTHKEQSLCRNASAEATLSSKSTKLRVRKPNVEHSSSRFFLLPTFPPWTSYGTVLSLGLFIYKPRVAIPAPSLRGSDEMTVGGPFVSQNIL